MNEIKQKNMWNHLSFNEDGFIDFRYELVLSDENFKKVKQGFSPVDISERYLAYFEKNILFIHSLMGGVCYVEIHFQIYKNYKCIKLIRKYNKPNPHQSEIETINFVNSFFYNIH